MEARVYFFIALLLLSSVTGGVVPAPTALLESQGASASSGSAASASRARVNVALQVGHWKVNELPDALSHLRGSTGTWGGGRTEAQLNLDIAQRTAGILRARGLTVEILPATVPTGYTADIFISLHADGNASSSPRGFKVSTRWRSEVAALDALLVQSLVEGYGNRTGLPEDSNITLAMRGYYAYSTYRGEAYRLGESTPAAILEMGYMSNPSDRALMFNNPDLIARGVADGVANYYARRAEGNRLQAEAERQAALSPYGRSAVVMADSANVRAGMSTSSRRLGSALFGKSFPLADGSSRPVNGWYRIVYPGSEAYIIRDLLVVQQ
jgi:hypothetical protein